MPKHLRYEGKINIDFTKLGIDFYDKILIPSNLSLEYKFALSNKY